MNKKILVTGAFGQIGSELVPALQEKYGADNIITLGHHHIPADFKGIVEKLSIENTVGLEKIVKKYEINSIYHLVSLLSAKGEKDPSLTWEINIGGLKNILDLAVKYQIKVFWPSSIAAFGPTTPRDMTPQRTAMEPTTMYGVTKVAGELLCQYYFLKYQVDVRSVRYPGIISYKAEPGGGTSDYAVAIFYDGLKTKKYECFVGSETILPMMYMGDAVRATINIMETDPAKLSVRTSYNLAGFSFKASELAKEVNKHIKVEVTYKPDFRQKIADSWPRSIDDSVARADWGWQPEYDLAKTTSIMLEKLKEKFDLCTGRLHPSG